MSWRWLRRLFWLAPEDRWSADIVIVPLGIYLAVKLGRARESLIAALGVALVVVTLRHLVFHFVVRKRRDRLT